MPYIQQKGREILDDAIFSLGRKIRERFSSKDRAGALNYTITNLLDELLEKPNYERINAAIGVLECAKLELYRRLAAPYEDKKIDENGDVDPYMGR